MGLRERRLPERRLQEQHKSPRKSQYAVVQEQGADEGTCVPSGSEILATLRELRRNLDRLGGVKRSTVTEPKVAFEEIDALVEGQIGPGRFHGSGSVWGTREAYEGNISLIALRHHTRRGEMAASRPSSKLRREGPVHNI